VISAGPARATQVIREALARGADRAIHVEGDVFATADAFVAAGALASALKEEQIDLVLTGLQSDDQGFAQVGVILAEKLGMAHSTIIMDVQVDPSTGSGQAGTIKVKRELEGGWFQWISMPMPAVLTIQSGINQLRYATLKGIMAAKKKEIKVVPGSSIPGFQGASRQRITSIYLPQKQKQTRMITGSPAEAAKELVRALREDARVF
jgi:electron transfer flavoprotein beta subunit